ncbi:hypothetical protein E2562_009300 [Oryza meyeriana var. granulata]|uniref:Uncharacterized protein n=1 Tax=Oryza meyeriana var. granulata TaxID=110450 RepID=A0A6G1CES7_9ORYZ|nr:hypothetical protein E2562_009300 [Oryza meyeriana var. granulata]
MPMPVGEAMISSCSKLWSSTGLVKATLLPISIGGRQSVIPPNGMLILQLNPMALRGCSPMPRPVGIKRAKKGKENVVPDEVKDMVKALVDAQAAQKDDMEIMKELQ